MPLVSIFWGFLYSIVGSLVGRILFSLGMGFVAYQGIDLLIETSKTAMMVALGGSSAVALQFAGVLQIGTAFNIILSAISIRLTLKGIYAGSLTKLEIKS